MDINDWKNIMEDHQRQLSDILADCQNGPDELVLLASKMIPLLQELQLLQDRIGDPIDQSDETNTETSE